MDSCARAVCLDQAAPLPKLSLNRLTRRTFNPQPKRQLGRGQDLRVDSAHIADHIRDGRGRRRLE